MSRRTARRLPRTIEIALLAVGLSVGVRSAFAHEPLFGIGPHTLYDQGVAVSASITSAAGEHERESLESSLALTYGLSENLNLTLGVPYLISGHRGGADVHGLGDAVLQVKWRPWTHMAPRLVDGLSLVGGLKLPMGANDVTGNNTGFLLGATLAREQLRYYLFSSVRYLTQTAGPNGRPGDVLRVDFAAGGRPVVLEYDQPDLVLLVELNTTWVRDSTAPAGDEEASSEGALLKHTGGTTTFGAADAGGLELAVTPEVLLSFRNVMLKGGVQLPVWGTDAFADGVDYRIRTDLIVQF